MSTPVCNPCAEVPVCLSPSDRYSLQDDVYHFVINCLPGFFCGGNSILFMVCCDGTIMQQTFAEGLSTAQRNALVNALITRCLRLEAFCDGDGTDGTGGGGDGTKNGGNDGTDPDNPIQLYSNRPQSSTVRCPDGLPFTYTLPPGVFVARTQELADRSALNYARTLAATLKVCLSGPLRTCCNGNPYASTIVASGGRGTFRWYITGSLPTGLVSTPIGNNGLRISGIPTTNGNFTFTVRAVDSFGNYMQKAITIKVWGITDTALPDAFTGIAYVYQIPVSNGTSPYTFSIVSGAFPNGITIGPDGIILGTPTEDGNFNISIRVVDSANRTCDKELTLESISSCPAPTDVTSYEVPATYQSETIDFNTRAQIWTARPAVIGNRRFGVSWDEDQFAMDVVDLTNPSAVRTLAFTVPWAAHEYWCWSAIYDPHTEMVLAHIHCKDVSHAIIKSSIVVFHPLFGYQSHVDIPEMVSSDYSTVSSLFVPMYDKPGKFIFRSGNELINQWPSFIYIYDANTSELTKIWPTVPTDRINHEDINYDCTNQEIMLRINSVWQCLDLSGAFVRNFPYPAAMSGLYYVDSCQKYVGLIEYQNSRWGLAQVDPITGALGAELTLAQMTAYVGAIYEDETWIQPENWGFPDYITLNRKLNRLCVMMASGGFDDNSYQWLTFIDPNTLEIKNTTLVLAGGFFQLFEMDNIVSCDDTGTLIYNHESRSYRVSPISIVP